MSTEPDYRDIASQIFVLRFAVICGQLEYSQAKLQAQPLLELLNQKAKIIANKYHRKPQRFIFAGFGRNLSNPSAHDQSSRK